MDFLPLVGLIVALLIITALAFYAGRLLYQLKQQNDRQLAARQARIQRITESIQTIAMAVEQQQCNLSEGAIRLVNLLHSLPVESPPNCKTDYPSLHALFVEVESLPTHQERANLPPEIRADQDKIREEHEARLENAILREMARLRNFSTTH